MCESNAYLKSKGKEELLLEDVVMIQPDSQGIVLTNILGEKKQLTAEIDHIDLLKHRIVLKPKG